MLTRLGLTPVADRAGPRAFHSAGVRSSRSPSPSLHQPRIVFLDEPTSGVDPITRRQFWELIYEAASYGTTVLVTTHYMDEAEYCDRISIMVAGRIAAIGAPADLKRNSASRRSTSCSCSSPAQVARPGSFHGRRGP